MKMRILPGLLTISLFLMTGCKDLLDVEERFTFQYTFSVNTDEHSFSDSRVIDLAANVSIIDEYGSKIKEVKIEQAKFWLTTFSGPDSQQIESGSLRVSETDGSNLQLIAELSDLQLQALLNTPHELTIRDAGVQLLGDLAADPPHRFQLHGDMEINEGPLAFTAVFEFTAKMVANPLN